MAGPSSNQTKTIPEFLAEHPDVDSRDVWARCWGILSDLKAQVDVEFELERHHTSSDLDSWTSGTFEGSLNTYTGPEAEWVVHSWIGNRSSSILDMNLQVWLGPHIDVPHLALVFGTIPQVFHYSDYMARRDLFTDTGYVERYYEPANEAFLALRGDDRFSWSVSHGTYMRSVLSPVAMSVHAERSDDVLDTLETFVRARFDQWLGWVREARAGRHVPSAERAALSARDHDLRRNCYTLDPMNELAKKFMDADTVARLVDARYGRVQIAESEGAAS